MRRLILKFALTLTTGVLIAPLAKAQSLYVSNYGDNTIRAISLTGTVITFASGLNGPAGLAFGGNDLYVGNYGTTGAGNSISKVTPTRSVRAQRGGGLGAIWRG